VIDCPPLSLHGNAYQACPLPELSAALDQASSLTMMLCDYCNGDCDAPLLLAQIKAWGAEVEAIGRR